MDNYAWTDITNSTVPLGSYKGKQNTVANFRSGRVVTQSSNIKPALTSSPGKHEGTHQQQSAAAPKKNRASELLSSIKNLLIERSVSGRPDFNDPAATAAYIESLKRLSPFSKKLLIDFATQEERAAIIGDNRPYSYDIILYNPDNRNHDKNDFIFLHQLDDNLRKQFLDTENIPADTKKALSGPGDCLLRIKITPCYDNTTQQSNIRDDTDQQGDYEWYRDTCGSSDSLLR